MMEEESLNQAWLNYVDATRNLARSAWQWILVTILLLYRSLATIARDVSESISEGEESIRLDSSGRSGRRGQKTLPAKDGE